MLSLADREGVCHGSAPPERNVPAEAGTYTRLEEDPGWLFSARRINRLKIQPFFQ
jgi:hypothetical protein